MKKVLVISYSQAGQTQRALLEFVKGFEKHCVCDQMIIQPKEGFPFPWRMSNFFRIFPRCVRGLAPEIEPLNIAWDEYDLVIFGFQVWFLSPSLPVQGFLKSPYASGLKGKKVLTIATCRNLWHSASRTIKEQLTVLGSIHLGQITLAETSPVWASFVTTPRWMLTGKKNGFWFFPPAGIRDEDFLQLQEKGQRAGDAWLTTQGAELYKADFGSNLNKLSLVLMDAIGHRFFLMWSSLILCVAPRVGLWQDLLLVVFRLNLVLLILSVGPCTKLVEILLGNKAKKYC